MPVELTQINNIYRGAGSPESSQVGSVGDFYFQTDGATDNVVWYKETGAATDTGWVNLVKSHNELRTFQGGTSGEYYHLTSAQHTAAISIYTGSGSPNLSQIGNVGDLYRQTDGVQGEILWEKTVGTGNTGWEASSYESNFQTLTYGATIDWEVTGTSGTERKNAIITLTGDATLNEPTGMRIDEDMILLIKQDGTGGHTLSFPTDFEFIGNPAHTEVPSGYDLLRIRYENNTGKFYCSYDRPLGYNEYLVLPVASNIDVDFSAYTDKQVRELFGTTIYLNNTQSTSGGSDSILPDLDQCWVGYELGVIMDQSANGGDLTLTTAKVADLLYASGVENIPFLDTNTPMSMNLLEDQRYRLYFKLVVRNYLGLKTWAIVDFKARFIGGVGFLSSTGAVTWDLLTGTYKTVTPTGAITLSISNMDESYPELLTGVIFVTQGGTPFDIELPANSKVPDGDAYLIEDTGTYTLENMAASETGTLTYAYDGTDYRWRFLKDI